MTGENGDYLYTDSWKARSIVLFVPVLALLKILEHLLNTKQVVEGTKGFDVAQHCFRSLLESTVDLKEVQESSEIGSSEDDDDNDSDESDESDDDDDDNEDGSNDSESVRCQHTCLNLCPNILRPHLDVLICLNFKL